MEDSLIRVQLGKIHCTPVTAEDALTSILELTRADRPHLVVTPNIAHVWQAETSRSLVQAYESATLAPPDGWPVVRAMRLLAPERPVERVTGADLLVDLCKRPLRVSLIGGKGSSAVDAAKQLTADNPGLQVVSVEPVPPAELTEQASRSALIDRLVRSDSDVYFVGLGVPKQEDLALDLIEVLSHGVVMCVGASIEFAAGTLDRAPQIWQTARLEWLYRLLAEPRKLARRYIFSSAFFIRTVLRETRNTRTRKGTV